MTNLAPHVICVPLHGNPDVPHLVYAGKAVTLKGIARDAGALTYQWDFGDGTTSAVAAVTDQYVIQATHTYIGPPNRSFTARLTVGDAQGLSGSDEYRLVMRPDTASTRAEVAVDEALWGCTRIKTARPDIGTIRPTTGRTTVRPRRRARCRRC